MRDECTVSSASTATLTPNSSWWDVVHNSHANSVSSFYHKNNNNDNNNPIYVNNLNGSCEDDVSISTTSITNASNHSGLTAESTHHHCLMTDQSASSDELLRDHFSTHNHLWSHFLLHGGSSVDTHNSGRSLGEQMIDHQLASKNSSSTSESFEPTVGSCDNYLKKMDNSNNFWSYSSQLRYGLNGQRLVQSERLSKMSNLVGNWSIAPPTNPDMNHHFDASAQTSDISLCSTFPHQYKQPFEDSGCYSGHDLKIKSEEFCYNNQLGSSNLGYLNDLGGSMIHNDGRYINGIQPSACENSGTFLDIRLSRPLTDINPSFRPCLKSLGLSELKKKELQTTLATGSSGITNEGKKKRCDEVSDEVSKKAKSSSSAVSQAKELPKAKLRDKITTLQQIVSPFGKTDTASVLQESITYIKFLQEQVKLLSTPYLKNSLKDPWVGWERETAGKGDTKYIDLRSRGLCLVPISCTPHAYRESTGADYFSPTYRGCLYR